MSIQFKKAERQAKPARIGVLGQTGSGKTLSSLLLAKGLTNSGKVLIIDTENGRASLKANNPIFEGWEFYAYQFLPEKANPTEVLKVAQDAVKEGFEAIIYDSVSHFWEWTLNKKEQLGDAWRFWAQAKAPYYTWFREGVIALPVHTILTLRTDMKYEQDVDSNGRKKVTKLGLQPKGEKDIEYDLDIVFSLRRDDHLATIQKTEDGIFSDNIVPLSVETGRRIYDWLSQGSEYDPTAIQKAKYLSRVGELYVQVNQVESIPSEELQRLRTLSLSEIQEYGVQLSQSLANKES